MSFSISEYTPKYTPVESGMPWFLVAPDGDSSGEEGLQGGESGVERRSALCERECGEENEREENAGWTNPAESMRKSNFAPEGEHVASVHRHLLRPDWAAICRERRARFVCRPVTFSEQVFTFSDGKGRSGFVRRLSRPSGVSRRRGLRPAAAGSRLSSHLASAMLPPGFRIRLPALPSAGMILLRSIADWRDFPLAQQPAEESHRSSWSAYERLARCSEPSDSLTMYSRFPMARSSRTHLSRTIRER